jgi:hypothetical protein
MARYSIWVLEYCYNDHYPMSAMVYGAHNQGIGMIPNCYVVVKGEGHVAMVVAGPDAVYANRGRHERHSARR